VERGVAQLAAAGRSNREISEALCLSRETVENYLPAPTRSWASPAAGAWRRCSTPDAGPGL